MNYTKPEVAVLGSAALVIENIPYKDSVPLGDGAFTSPTPAYDLDE